MQMGVMNKTLKSKRSKSQSAQLQKATDSKIRDYICIEMIIGLT